MNNMTTSRYEKPTCRNFYISYYSTRLCLSEFQYIVQFTTPKISNVLKKKIYHEKIEVAAKGNTFIVIRPKSEEDIAHFQRTIAFISTSREIIKVKKDFMIDRNNFDFNENVQNKFLQKMRN